MPFNKELENFAEAFSAGYGMTKSKEEREAEQLNLEKQRLEVERLPTQYAQEDTKFGLDVEFAKGRLTDAEAARERAKIDQAHTDAAFNLDQQVRQGQLTDAQAARERAKIDQAHADAKFEIDQQLGGLQIQGAEGTLEDQRHARERLKTTEPQQDAAAALEGRKGEALIRQSDAATGSSLATTEGQKVDTDIKKLQLKREQDKDTLLNGLRDRIKKRKKPAINQPHAVEAPGSGGLSIEGEPSEVLPPAVGPTSAVDVEPTVAQRAREGETVSSFSGEGLEGPAAGSTEGLPVEATPTGYAPAPVPPPSPMEAVDASGVVSPPGQEVPAAPNAERQEVIDHFVSGKDTLPNGKKIFDVAGKYAVIDGLTGMVEQNGLNQDSAVDTPETEDQSRGFLTGATAADPAVVEMLEKTVQEQAGDEEMSQNELTYNTLTTGWLYSNAMGEPEEAKKYAQALMSHYQMVFGQYVAMAHASAEAGDHEHTANALERAYANVPTNDELTIRPSKDKKHYIAKITDSKGNVTEQQLMTPEEMGAYAMEIDPSSFVSLIAQAAGREDKTISQEAADKMSMPDVAGLTEEQVRIKQAQEAAGKKDQPTYTELKDMREEVTTSLDNFVTATPKFEEFFNNEDTGRRADLQTVTEQLYQNNYPKLNPHDAAAVTMNILTGGLSKPPVMTDDSPTVTINVPGQQPLDLPKAQYMTLVTLREMGQFRDTEVRPPAPSKSWGDYIPGYDTAPAEAVDTSPGAAGYSPRFSNGQKLPAGAAPGPLETIFGYIGGSAPEKSRMPNRAVGAQKLKEEPRYHRGTQPPRR